MTWYKNSKGEWYVIGQFLLFGFIALAPRWQSASWGWASQMVGVLLFVVGSVLVLFGLVSLGQNLSALPHPKESAQLVIEGAYTVVRHPIYAGILIGALGWSLFMSSWLALLFTSVLFVLFDFKSRREEIWLTKKFKGYPTYQKQVKKLLPFIY